MSVYILYNLSPESIEPVRLTAPWSLCLTWKHWELFQKRRRREWYRKILSNSYLNRRTFILWLPRQALKLMVSNLDRAAELDFRLYSTNNWDLSDMRTYSLHGWLVPYVKQFQQGFLPSSAVKLIRRLIRISRILASLGLSTVVSGPR